MVVAFALPVVAAWFFYLNPQYLPSTRANQGELIEPQVPLDAGVGLLGVDGAPFDLAPLAGRWTLVALEAPPCDAACRDRLTALRQIRLALGESRLGVERLLLLTGPDDTAALSREFDGLRIALAPGSVAERLLADLGQGAAALGRTYIRDPMGQLMMRYPADAPAQHTLKDMERLLKASKNWIKGASYGHR
jgi:cytochrome oxidase Cu insertion factor (SCO1/SenC/PrrC family)